MLSIYLFMLRQSTPAVGQFHISANTREAAIGRSLPIMITKRAAPSPEGLKRKTVRLGTSTTITVLMSNVVEVNTIPRENQYHERRTKHDQRPGSGTA